VIDHFRSIGDRVKGRGEMLKGDVIALVWFGFVVCFVGWWRMRGEFGGFVFGMLAWFLGCFVISSIPVLILGDFVDSGTLLLSAIVNGIVGISLCYYKTKKHEWLNQGGTAFLFVAITQLIHGLAIS
jgi:hypothetical protein